MHCIIDIPHIGAVSNRVTFIGKHTSRRRRLQPIYNNMKLTHKKSVSVRGCVSNFLPTRWAAIDEEFNKFNSQLVS